MRKLPGLLVPVVFIAFCIPGCTDGLVAPEEPVNEADPDFLKPVPVPILDYDLQDMRLKFSKRTGELTATIAFKNMGSIPCSGTFLDPSIIVQTKPASSQFWFFPSYFVGFVCDQPGGSGEVVSVELELPPGTWDIRAILYDQSSDVDQIRERYSVK